MKAASTDRPSSFGQRSSDLPAVVDRPSVTGAGGREHDAIAVRERDAVEPTFEERHESRIRTQGPGDDDRVVRRGRGRAREVDPHVVPGRQQKGNDDDRGR